MDFIQGNFDVTHLTNLLPPSLASLLFQISSTLLAVFEFASSHLAPLLTRITTQPDLASILLLLAILFISFKILDMALRTVMFWVTLIFRLAFWGAIGMLGVWIYTRGIDGFIEDAQGLGEHWRGEYEKYEGEFKKYQQHSEARLKQQQGGRSRWR